MAGDSLAQRSAEITLKSFQYVPPCASFSESMKTYKVKRVNVMYFYSASYVMIKTVNLARLDLQQYQKNNVCLSPFNA